MTSLIPIDDIKETLMKQIEYYLWSQGKIKLKLMNGQIFSGNIQEILEDRLNLKMYDSEKNCCSIVPICHIDPMSIIPLELEYSPINLFQREQIEPSKRFFILNRDNYTCKYCGKKPPEVELEIDHIFPVSLGGTNDINNLITSCFNCNRGKSNKQIGNWM